MLVRDSVPRLRVFASRYVCPNCLTRGFATRSLPATYPVSSSYIQKRQIERLNLQGHHPVAHRSFATTRTHRATGAALASTTSPLDNSLLFPSGLGLDSPDDVRAYLKKWSQDHQKIIRDNAPDQVQIERHTALPNSLFLRNNIDATREAEDDFDTDAEAATNEIPTSSEDGIDDFTLTQRTELKPGDTLRISAAGNVRGQLAIYLGVRGVQSLYLLADGRWWASCRQIFKSHIIDGFASPAELSRIEPHLPQKAVEYQKAEDGAIVPFSVFGDIPHTDSRHLIQKLAMLAEEVDDAKRQYQGLLEQLYNDIADESEFKFTPFNDLLRDHQHIDVETLTNGARMYLFDSIWNDARLDGYVSRGTQIVGFLPKKMYRSMVQVTQWARSYQDAAARAAMGKNVSEELSKNPLIPFISKARRLISKSRKIRLPTLECELGPTLEAVRPPPGTAERRRNDEEFTEDEKKVIEFLWLVYVKRPEGRNAGTRRNKAIASLIIRAVGAYPNFTLDSPTGALFLKELGCLDPWAHPADYLVDEPHTRLGLHQPARLAREKVRAGVASLGIQPGQETICLPDTMAHIRKDWGDLEVLCIDSASTKVIDDGISVELSQEFPDHYWVRVHVAHLSAFVPYDSPVLALGEIMGATQYRVLTGSEPYIPHDVVLPYSLGSNKPVLTISTLLSPDGSIKDIEITPGIIRNVVKIDLNLLKDSHIVRKPSNILKAGAFEPVNSQPSESDHNQKQPELDERHRKVIDLLQRLSILRWEARFRESDEHLKMLKLPITKQSVKVFPPEVIHDTQYERIFRSEHVIGDPTVSVKCELIDQNKVVYRDQAIKYDPVAGSMMMASEATALWTTARRVPVIYRHTEVGPNSSLSKLNSLGPHDFYVGFGSGESVDISRNLALSMAGYINITSPLRRYKDLINHYQIDAYFKAQAGQPEQLDGRDGKIEYPRSRQQLIEAIKRYEDGGLFAKHSRLQLVQWIIGTLYRAFYFQEGRLPEVWDVFISNPVSVGQSFDAATTTKGVIHALGLVVDIDPSEQGWEKMAKFRQYLPCKVSRVTPGEGKVRCVPVGPPSDEPSVKDLVYPELQPEVMG